ncbi:phosphoenolpyruvate--protein phosphotransferase [Sandaracinobacter sp. RS1-74]|uniref:phosphoenolpyruvate--protein phosphotransferase n=1 Tax=Sandaracinobacteroides sayramensis TaxID=2913411 RepID=UPI001EDA46A7|nr:phosphoenolpyruvate--protein phosphotransferase [Sandaracinobacteroides sayramensis]MCG2842105.1 phosphoenolpyruvate--protein phosphotransferase [Sandaracinobacteroides sayramensis]
MIEIQSPLTGWAAPLSELPDPVFADAMLGDGVQIDPTEGLLLAPADGRIESLHPAHHAITLACDSGPLLLLHVGLETVALKGRGFEPLVAQGARVAAGQPLLRFDLDLLAREARSLATPILVTNGAAFRIVERASGLLAAGAPLLRLEATGAAVSQEAVATPAVARELRLPLAHGLHARPAARIAQEAGRFRASVRIGSGERSAPAESPVALLALALPHGAQIEVQASGPEAEAAAEAIATLLESGMGEHRPVATETAIHPERPLEAVLNGIRAAPGRAIGPAFQLRRAEIPVNEKAADAASEQALLDEARARVADGLRARAAGEGPAAEIAAAHLGFLHDPALLKAAAQAIAGGASAGIGWRRATDSFAAQLAGASARFAERVSDLRDVERQILSSLAGGVPAAEAPPPGAILLADDPGPSELMALAEAGLGGIACAEGGPTSHTAIIAQSLGLPMLCALGPLGAIPDGRPLLLDADSGRLETAPSAERLAKAGAEAEKRAARRAAALAQAHLPTVTLDGEAIELFANIGSLADARAAALQQAEGCGLLRTEFLFLDRADAPAEEEQRHAVQAIADALAGKPLIVRTLDIGADKPAPWLDLRAEANPALGLRGIRLQLARPGLLESQFRALLAVDAPIRVMLPMVAHLHELSEARATLNRLAKEIGRAPPPLGIMVETPAAALMARQLAAEADFFSIGSNDLTQYALAADRTNPAVAASLDGLHPAVLKLMALTVEGAGAAGRWVGLCGSLAAEAEAVPILIGLGLRELSVPPAAVAETKALVRGLSLAECRALAARALQAPDAAAARRLLSPNPEARA